MSHNWDGCSCIHAVFLAWNAIVMMYLPAYGEVMVDDQTSAARAVIIVASQVHCWSSFLKSLFSCTLHGKIEQQLFLCNLDSHLQPMGVLVCVHWLQKTFPVVVAVVSKLGGAIGETGLLVLPCITYHLTQIMLDSMLVNFWLNYSKTNKFSTSWEEKMISHGASDGELCKQHVKAAKCTPITLYTFQMENILCGSGWMTSCSLCLGVRGLATPFLFHKCSSDVAIFSWSQSQNLIGPLRTYAFAVQVSLIIVANPVKDQMDFEVWRYNTKFLAWVEILLSRYARSWIAQFILALFTFKYGRNNFIFFSIFSKVPNSLSFVQQWLASLWKACLLANCVGCKSMYAFSTPNQHRNGGRQFWFQKLVLLVQNTYFHDMRPSLQRVCMIHPLVLKGGKVLSKNLGQKIHELLCIIATLTICVDTHGHAYYRYFIPTFLSRNHLFSNI
jgi:hypothetical protein